MVVECSVNHPSQSRRRQIVEHFKQGKYFLGINPSFEGLSVSYGPSI